MTRRYTNPHLPYLTLPSDNLSNDKIFKTKSENLKDKPEH